MTPYAADDIKRKRRRDFEEFFLAKNLLIEYKINEFLSLKLEGSRTQIYVKGKRFLQCKRLVYVNSNVRSKFIGAKRSQDIRGQVGMHFGVVPLDEGDEDPDFLKLIGGKTEGGIAKEIQMKVLQEYHDITPEQEFWGHCSNLQAWYENDYDTRLVHSNLAFNLLKALVKAGDPNAKRVFKTEIAERFGSGYPNTIISIVNAKLLDYFSFEEKRELIRPNVSIILKCDPDLLDYFSLEEKRELIRPNVPIVLKYDPKLLGYFSLEEKRELIRPNVPIVLKYAPKLLDCFSSEEKREFIQENKAIIFEKFKNMANKIPNIFPYLFKERLLDFLELSEKEQLTKLDYPIILGFMKNYLMSNSLKKRYNKIVSITEKYLIAYLNRDQIKQVIHQNFDIILKYLEKLNQQKKAYYYKFKIIVLGDADTPKSSFTQRYCYNIFNPSEEDYTIGVDFHLKSIELLGKRIKLQIWDYEGEERFRFLLPTYCLGANAAILLYNITNPSTLEHLPDWIRIVREKAGDVPIILVGAKAHLEEFRAVSREEGILAAKKYNLSGFIEVSSKTGQNVEKAFELIIAILLEKYSTEITKIKAKVASKKNVINPKSPKEEKKKKHQKKRNS